jgi:hypothetical protein
VTVAEFEVQRLTELLKAVVESGRLRRPPEDKADLNMGPFFAACSPNKLPAGSDYRRLTRTYAGRNDRELAGAILDGRTLELVVLTLLVELDAGADTDVVGNVGRPDCID